MGGFDADTSSYAGYGQTNRLLATATNTPEVANQWLANARGQQELQRGQLQLSQQHLGALNDLVSSVMADPSPQNAAARISDGVRMGVIPADEGAKELATIAGFGGDQNKIRQYAFQHGQVIATLAQRQEAAGMATPQLVNNGQQQVPMVAQGGLHPAINPAGGPPIQNLQSPGELAAPRTYTTPDGVTHQTTQSGYQQAVGDPSGGVNSQNSYVDPKRAAAGVSIVNGKPVYGAAPAAAAPGPGLAGPAPGVTGAADATAQAAAQQGASLAKIADQVPQQRATINNLAGQLDKIGTGPNAEKWNTIKAGWNAVAGVAGLPEALQADKGTIAAMEDFRHNAQVLANQMQSQLGGTDAGLAAGARSNPNLDISTLGNKNIVASLNGLADANEVKGRAWQKWLVDGHSTASYNEWATDFNKSFSPRAFQWVRLDAAGKADMKKSMSPQDKAALAKALDTAEANGWIKANGE